MTQLVINIENPDILPSLKRVLKALDGVSIAKTSNPGRKKKSGLEEAIEEADKGKVTRWESVDKLVDHITALSK